jgi:predicted metal-dependent phosphoesterase TrpH
MARVIVGGLTVRYPPLYTCAVRIDLHVHSNASDGSDTPAEVMRRAREAGLDIVALTDHDTVAGVSPARDALPSGLRLVEGMELSTRAGEDGMHLLAYEFDANDPALAAETERIRDDRVYRARAMVDKLAELGTDVTWDQVAAIAGDAVVGRPHIARALADAGVVATPADAFTTDWIGEGGRAHVSKYAPDPVRAIELVRAAGGVAVLAHPRSPGYEVPDEVIVQLAGAGLAGLEVFHPDHDDATRQDLLALASHLHLVPTGGSDDHGDLTGYQIGRETTSPPAFEELLERAG